MFKLYKKADILEKISDKVKTVDDLLNLPLSEFDRECCDYWFNDYLDSKEYRDRGYYVVCPDKEFFYDAFYLMECRKECKFLVLIEFGEILYFIFDPLETENNLCASRDIRLVAILKQQLEGLVSCEDVQIVER